MVWIHLHRFLQIGDGLRILLEAFVIPATRVKRAGTGLSADGFAQIIKGFGEFAPLAVEPTALEVQVGQAWARGSVGFSLDRLVVIGDCFLKIAKANINGSSLTIRLKGFGILFNLQVQLV